MKKIVLALVILIILVITIVFLYPSENSSNDINSKNYQETSTKKNDPKFQNDFGNMYANGTNVHQSYEEAIKWYEK